MLDFQLVQAPFRFGIDEGTDPKQVPFGTLLTAQNVVWRKSGRLQKRQGTATLTTSIVGGGTISAASRLLTRGEELGLISAGKLYSYTTSGWVDHGKVSEVGIEWSTLQDQALGMQSMDVARLTNGQIVMAWTEGDPASTATAGSTVWYQTIDGTTGGTVTTKTSGALSARAHIRLVTNGTDWVLLSNNAGGLHCVASIGGTVTLTTLKSDASTSFQYCGLDACLIGSEFVVAYALAAGGIRLLRYTFASTPVEQANVTVAGVTSTQLSSISVSGSSSDVLFIAWADENGDTVQYATANPSTLAQVLAPTLVESSTGLTSATVSLLRSSATTAVLGYSFESTSRSSGILHTCQVSTAGVVSADKGNGFLRLLSRPFALGSRYYVLAGNFTLASTFNPDTPISGSEVFLLDATPEALGGLAGSRQVGKVEMLNGGVWMAGYASSAIAVSATEVRVPSPFQSSAASSFTAWRQGAHLARLLIDASLPQDMWRSVSYGPEAYIVGGVLGAYDGLEVAGYGWAHGPYLDPDKTVASASSGSIQTGTYIYNVTAERRSAAGILHRSPVGVQLTKSVTGPTGSVLVTTTATALTTRLANQGIYAVYRTTAGGSIPQRLTVEPRYSVGFSSSTSGTVLDTRNDTDVGGVALATRPAMYTQGGELEDFQPPAVITATIYRDRIFAILGDRNTVAFTKSFAESPGTAGGFNYAFRIPFNDTLTGLSVLDERLIVFSETGIYTMAGDGPAPNGDGSDYGAPNKVQTDVGCTNPRGIVSGPDGVYFVTGDSSVSEIHILDRGLNVQWIGKPVQDLLDAYPTVTSAVLVPSKNHVRFTCQASDGLTGVVLVYDYQEKQWSHFAYGASLPIADAILHNNVYTFVTTAGVVYQESESVNTDAGAWVTARLETAWIYATGPLAYQSVRAFQIDGVALTAHGLSVYVGFNGNSSYEQGPRTWAEATSGVTSPGNQTAKVSIGTRRKCSQIRFKIEDSAPVTIGAGTGAAWSSMGIEVGIKRGLGRLAQRQMK